MCAYESMYVCMWGCECVCVHVRVCMCACGGVLNIKYKCHVAYVISVHKLTKCAAEDCRHSVIALTQNQN